MKPTYSTYSLIQDLSSLDTQGSFPRLAFDFFYDPIDSVAIRLVHLAKAVHEFE